MTRSYKTDDKPLLNLAGALSRCSREGDYVYTKEGTRSPPLSTVTTGGLVCIRWTKQGVGVKCANEQMRRVDWAAAEHLQSPFPSPFFRVKWLYDFGFWVWMEAGRWFEFRPKMFLCNCTLQSSNSERSDLRFEALKRICYNYGSRYWSLERLWKPVFTGFHCAWHIGVPLRILTQLLSLYSMGQRLRVEGISNSPF